MTISNPASKSPTRAWPSPHALPWADLASPLASAEDALARLDERLRTSPILEGFRARQNFADACASLWLEGGLVHLEDLVLHDAGMDIRAPTHELVRAHKILRDRRRIFDAAPDWALSSAGLDFLRGRAGEGADAAPSYYEQDRDHAQDDDLLGEDFGGGTFLADAQDKNLNEAFAALDAAVAGTKRLLADEIKSRRPERDPLVYDLDWNEDLRLADWRRIVDETKTQPPVLAAALALDAWEVCEPLEHLPWLGRLLAASLLRARGKTKVHLAALNIGLRAIPRERRFSRDPTVRLMAKIEAIGAAGEDGLKTHDRWLLARNLLTRKLIGRRRNCSLPALIDLVMARPMVSAGIIARELEVTQRAAQNMVAELGLRETTGRGRYRAWGVL